MGRLYTTAMLSLVLIALASCHKADYMHVIPHDATIVVSADMTGMAEEADLGNSSLMQLIDQNLGLIASDDTRRQFRNYIDHPADMGIDFASPVYFFMAGDFAGMTVRLTDDDDLKKFVEMLTDQNLCRSGQEADGVRTTLLFDDVVLAHDAHTLLALANMRQGSVAQTRQLALQLMGQDKELSFASTEACARMADDGGSDVSCYVNGAALSDDMLSVLKSLMPAGLRPVDVELYSTLSFDKGKAVATAQATGKSNTARKLLDEANDNFRKIEGRYVDSPQKDFAVWACLGAKGSWLLEHLKQQNDSKRFLLMLERAIDIEQIIRSIDGDIAVTLPAEAIAGGAAASESDFMLMAKVSDTDFLKDVDYWQKTMRDYGVSMSKTKGNDYVLAARDYTLNWGVDGNDVYFASPRMFASNVTSERSTLLKDMKDDITQCQFFAYLNLETITKRTHPRNAVVKNIISQLKSLIVRSKSAGSIEITVELKEQDKNFLKAVL